MGLNKELDYIRGVCRGEYKVLDPKYRGFRDTDTCIYSVKSSRRAVSLRRDITGRSYVGLNTFSRSLFSPEDG